MTDIANIIGDYAYSSHATNPARPELNKLFKCAQPSGQQTNIQLETLLNALQAVAYSFKPDTQDIKAYQHID